jgi:putative transcriptional regulator
LESHGVKKTTFGELNMPLKTKERKMKNRLFELIRQQELKEGRRITQKEIAEFADVTEHNIGKWIRNEMTRYDTKVVERICGFFDCDLSDLLYFEFSDEDLPQDPDQD